MHQSCVQGVSVQERLLKTSTLTSTLKEKSTLKHFDTVKKTDNVVAFVGRLCFFCHHGNFI